MKITKTLMHTAIAVICWATLMACNGNGIKPLNGTLEQPMSDTNAPETVVKTMENAVIDSRYENIMTDEDNKVSVWSLMKIDDNNSSEGYGIIVVKDGIATAFPNIRHGNNPSAHYNTATKQMLITGAAMEGTGVLVEQPYILVFGDDGHATIEATIDPYDMQQEALSHAGYKVEGEQITLYNDKQPIYTATNTITDMGGFDDQAVWIGEQIAYDISGDDIVVQITPGVNYVVGKVLLYDDMPTITARVSIDENGKPSLNDVEIAKESDLDE